MEKKRNTGLDFLRILSMFMIVMLHLLSKGGALWDTVPFSGYWLYSWGLEALCFCSTNCYVLISGYFLAQSKEMRWKKVLRLLAEVWAYSIVIFLIMLAAGFKPTGTQIINSFLPFYSKSYWFINSYILMYILHPFVNKMLDKLEKKDYKKLLIILFVFFSLAQTITPYADWTMDDSWGYGIIWFECLFIFAGYIRRFGISPKITRIKCLLGYIIGVICMLGSRIVLIKILDHFGKSHDMAEIWYAYNSIPVLLCSVCLFLIFLKTDFKHGGKAISFLGSATLGVYLMHEQGFLRDYFWHEILGVEKWTNNSLQPVMDILYGLGVFVCCMIISCIVHLIINIFKKKKTEAATVK